MPYRILNKDEEVQEGDEVDACSDPWKEFPKWVPAKNIGRKVPDPQYPAHSIYRRWEKEQ